jgi:Zn-dependent M28 family amino/carboxypeptidase
MRMIPRGVSAFLLLAVLFLGCKQGTSSSAPPSPASSAATQAPSEANPAPVATAGPGGVAPALQVDGEHAMSYVRQEVAFGPRPVGSAAHKKLEDFLRKRLKADTNQVEEDGFTAQTPEGAFPMRNFIAKFPGTRDGIIVVASHYDTLYNVKNFVGANDGGSSGLLLEMADKLRSTRPRKGYSVWIVFLDGEEALRAWTDTDSVYGARHLEQKWQQEGTLKKIKGFLLADMVGDAELDIQRDENSTPWLEDAVGKAATNLGYQSYFFAQTTAVEDDHIPFMKAGVPCADLIDFTYGYDNVFWHTPQDTLDKLSPKSLTIAGDVMFETIALLDQR